MEKLREYMIVVFFENQEADELLDSMTPEEIREVMTYVGLEDPTAAEHTKWPVVLPKPIKLAS